MRRAGQRLLPLGRLRRCSSFAAVEADPHSVVFGSYRLIVDIRNGERSKVVHGAIVRERIIFPAATLIAVAVIAVAIGNTALKADFGCPITGVERIAAFDPAPIGRRP